MENQARVILVVDDDLIIIEGTRNILERRGFRVLTAKNGQAALHILKAQKPDLILTDVLMPVMDGFSFYKELKKNPATADIPVLVMTARGPMEDTFKVAGADGFMTKPFSPVNLTVEIDQILSIQGARQDIQKENKQSGMRTVLLVGTQQKILNEMVVQLKKSGCEAAVVYQNKDIVPRVLKFLPDMIFMDVQLEKEQIAGIVQLLRQQPKFIKRPIIGYSYCVEGDSDNPEVRRKMLEVQNLGELFLQAGGTDYMGRFELSKFIDVLKQYLSYKED